MRRGASAKIHDSVDIRRRAELHALSVASPAERGWRVTPCPLLGSVVFASVTSNPAPAARLETSVTSYPSASRNRSIERPSTSGEMVIWLVPCMVGASPGADGTPVRSRRVNPVCLSSHHSRSTAHDLTTTSRLSDTSGGASQASAMHRR